jgi:curli biogenesis system outer membrane secretion channel CsgG
MLTLTMSAAICALAGPAHAEISSAAKQLEQLPRKQGERVAVTIYEFRSQLPALNASTATDMFTTAIVTSGQFRVVERNRMNAGVVREKQLQQDGWADGDVAQQQLKGAQFIFEGTWPKPIWRVGAPAASTSRECRSRWRQPGLHRGGCAGD